MVLVWEQSQAGVGALVISEKEKRQLRLLRGSRSRERAQVAETNGAAVEELRETRQNLPRLHGERRGKRASSPRNRCVYDSYCFCKVSPRKQH